MPDHTLDGYSQQIAVHGRCVLRIRHPASQRAAVAPLRCAGITTYSALRHWKLGPGTRVADIKMILTDEIKAAGARMVKGDVKYRFVIDMAWLVAWRHRKGSRAVCNGGPTEKSGAKAPLF